MTAMAIQFQNASLSRGNKAIFSDLSLEIRQGDSVAILGPSGIGKSSLLMVMARILPLSSGSLAANSATLMQQRAALLPWLSAKENVLLGVKLINKSSLRASKALALDLLGKVGLREVAHAKPAELSGGQQQRVALARALAIQPDILLLDEPFSALDAGVRQQLRNDLAALQRELNFTLVLVTHDQADADALCQRHIHMTSDALLEPLNLDKAA